MRRIDYIVLHCTGTQPEAKIPSIQRYWREVKGWKSPGYHIIIEANGDYTMLLPFDKVSNGVAGHNAHSIHVCYIGGIDRKGKAMDTRTPEQIKAMTTIVKDLQSKYPTAKVLGHRDFPKVKKACPSFDVAAWLKTIA